METEGKKIRKIIILGTGASGKDHAKTILESYGFSVDVSCTTRKPRTGETHGKDYFFIDKDEMLRNIHEKKFLQWNRFINGDCYGTLIEQWDENNLFIMTPNVISVVREFYKANGIEEDFITLFLDIDMDVRILRMKNRGFLLHEIDQRNMIDRLLFENFEADITVQNDNFKDVTLLDAIFTNNDYDMSELKAVTLKRK